MRLLIFAILLGSSARAWATEPPGTMLKGFSFSSGLSYTAPGRDVKTSRDLILTTDNEGWTQLAIPKDGVTLLGRIVEATEQTVKVEYIVVDTTEQDCVIYTPALIAKFGEKAEIKIDTGSHSAAISLVAQKTEFWSE